MHKIISIPGVQISFLLIFGPASLTEKPFIKERECYSCEKSVIFSREIKDKTTISPLGPIMSQHGVFLENQREEKNL
jgi:hypothetical protein